MFIGYMLIFFIVRYTLRHFLYEFLILLLVSLLRIVCTTLIASTLYRDNYSVLSLALLCFSFTGFHAVAVFLLR